MDSLVSHPNVFNRYICADVLKEGLGYTPAYTLKGIAIQMLSFFSSDRVEQGYGGTVSLAQYRETEHYGSNDGASDNFACDRCGFKALPAPRSDQYHLNPYGALGGDHNLDSDQPPSPGSGSRGPSTFAIQKLPNELLLLILENLEDFEDITRFAKVWPRVSRLIGDFDIIRQRELQCFVTKQTYQVTKLGIGVSVRKGQIASEFDLLSKEAFFTFKVRRSVHNIGFDHWLPLPISRRHWMKTRSDLRRPLDSMKQELGSPSAPYVQLIYHFMSDIVVRLNKVADNVGYESSKSTLRHASEKAIGSYFHLFHLLVCMATEDLTVVQNANHLLRNFAEGRRSKDDCPNLGHLLIALLISDVEVTDDLAKAIVTEAITRNVVWLLDGWGANMAELSYLEPAPVSAYRLDRTFEGSRTSYRLLMFSELFRRTARPSHKKPLREVREELFDRYGAPPRGAAGRLAASVRRLHTINDFPAFLREMGLRSVPSPENFTDVLRQTVVSSMEKGYSTWALTQQEAMLLRTYYEPEVPMTPEMREWARQHRYDDVMIQRSTSRPTWVEKNKQKKSAEFDLAGSLLLVLCRPPMAEYEKIPVDSAASEYPMNPHQAYQHHLTPQQTAQFQQPQYTGSEAQFQQYQYSDSEAQSQQYQYTGSEAQAQMTRDLPEQQRLMMAAQPPQPGPTAYGQQGGEWQASLCNCSPCSSCLLSCFLPCILVGKTSERMRDPSMQNANLLNSDCLIHGALMCFTGCGWIYAMLKRGEIRERYNIKGSGCNDCCVSFWCQCCAAIQQDNEVIIRQRKAAPIQQGYQSQPGMGMPGPAPAYKPT
ncbi:hypothetical protein DL771_004897 [Monosporascus sp. 5C6A]|nr:hypothetical protein DL771_004897 [Monosporascus sp. 5C6A]